MQLVRIPSGSVTLTIDTQVLALLKETQAVASRTAAESSLQHSGQGADVGGVDITGVGGLVAARKFCVVPADVLALRYGLAADGVLTATARLGQGHHHGSEAQNSCTELHVCDG